MNDAQPGRRAEVALLAVIVALFGFIIVSALVTGTTGTSPGSARAARPGQA